VALNAAVVSDSTTLITLINIERFDLLFDFSHKIIIPPSVYREVSMRKPAREVLDRYIREEKIAIMEVADGRRVQELMIRLDIGESESIVLADEQNLPLIIDEKRGKKIANENRLETIGLIGILLIYRRRNFLSPDEITTITEELRTANFRISKALMALLQE
jgi:predicted nucleic acid-binding protein